MKKTIIIATVILFFVIIFVMVFSLNQKGQPSTAKNFPTPTLVEVDMTRKLNIQDKELFDAAKSLAPYETESFKYYYSIEKDKLVVEYKTPAGEKDFNDWVNKNNINGLSNNSDLIIVTNNSFNSQIPSPSKNPENLLNTPSNVTPTPNTFNKLLESLFSLGLVNLTTSSTSSQTEPLSKAPKNKLTPPISSQGNISGGLVYYGQCQSGDISLPDGCNLCQAGCGPTTAAMILSSYLSKEYDPKKVVSIYASRGYYLGCGGSSYVDAKSLFEDLGLKTTDYISFNGDTADEVAADFKKYIQGGWTIFTLANYCDGGCGHFFWITKVEGNNIFAYDPYYGQNQDKPLNENDRYPFPKYRIAFGVKKG